MKLPQIKEGVEYKYSEATQHGKQRRERRLEGDSHQEPSDCSAMIYTYICIEVCLYFF